MAPSSDTDAPSGADAATGHGPTGDGDDELERRVRRAVRAELRSQARAVVQVLAGVLFALVVLPALASAVYPSLFAAGVPAPLLAVGSLLVASLLVAYGWRLPPFR
jgi:hypothetical protein